ncbi:class I SAM-dependent methyltransferase [Halobacillus salinus]|uniref:Class I SAM-dependent methyltransferase n=1 Tax=Halobacillus salinus TaxID=192814 RepID=A0A4Z0H3K7_9BACI|nr:class I SAM-dependent methyltransferase [Halobacillus salinus]TGB04437.1 class I SAM-dependent methyltransferase [Halobacillus salinus]
MPGYGNHLFKGSAPYYAKYRPVYPSMLIRFLVEQFHLNGSNHILDLGCGTGHLTVRLADWCERITGVDQEPEMVEQARRLLGELRLRNIEFQEGTLDSYLDTHQVNLDLVIMAKSFHWMDRKKTLEQLYPFTKDGGGVAIIDTYDPTREPTIWQKEFQKVVEMFYGNERKAGNTTYSHPEISHAQIIEESPFTYRNFTFPKYTQEWSVETILGNHYSTSFGSKHFLENQAAFEEEVRSKLLNINSEGVFREEVTLTVKMGVK